MAQKATSLFGRIFNFENAIVILCFMPIFLFRYTFILFPGPLGYGPFIAFYLLLPIFIVKYKVPFRELAWVIFVLMVGASGVMTGVIPNGVYIKVAGSIMLPYVFYAYVWRHFEYNVERLFTIYLKGAYVVSIIGLLLFVDSFVGYNLLHFLQLFIYLDTIDASFGIRLASSIR